MASKGHVFQFTYINKIFAQSKNKIDYIRNFLIQIVHKVECQSKKKWEH